MPLCWTDSVLRNARWGFSVPVRPSYCSSTTPLLKKTQKTKIPSASPVPQASRARQACGRPPSGTENHTGLIHLASGNRHLSLRIPLGTFRQGPILGWGGQAMWCTVKCIQTHTYLHTPYTVSGAARWQTKSPLWVIVIHTESENKFRNYAYILNPNKTSLGEVSIATARGAVWFWWGGGAHAVRVGAGR